MRTYDRDHAFPEFKSEAEYDAYVRKTYRAAILTAGAVHRLETEVKAAMMLDGMSLDDALFKYAPDYWQDGYRYCCHDLREAVRRRIVREQRIARAKARKGKYAIYTQENGVEVLCHRTDCEETARTFHADPLYRVEPAPDAQQPAGASEMPAERQLA